MDLPTGKQSAHLDDFVLRHLPPRSDWPRFDFAEVPAPRPYPDHLNCAEMLLSEALAAGHGARPALIGEDITWSYLELEQQVNRIANYLVDALGLVPGNRVLLRGWNGPMLAACWLAVAKAGGINVATVAMLRAGELGYILDKAQISHALVQDGLEAELSAAQAKRACLKHVVEFSVDGTGDAVLDRAIAAKSDQFSAVATAADDPVMIGITSGTTGQAKAAVHFHRAVLAASDCFPRDICPITCDSVIGGSPPLAFTFGLGVFVAIPLRYGASAVLLAQPSPEAILGAVAEHGVSDLFTVPTMYRAMLDQIAGHDLSALRRCMSAGEALPADTLARWRAATGLDIHDGIGSTEMLHHFIATAPGAVAANVTGRTIQGFSARVIDAEGQELKPGEIGHLAVRGPTGCLYLDDPVRQKAYVKDGWNITGDFFSREDDGSFRFISRSDDMIVSAGYNISGIEVEDAVLRHPGVLECAVVGAEDPGRGQVVCALVVLRQPAADPAALAREIQDFVKTEIAPYKYPRQLRFLDALPKTPTGKIQRFKLQQMLGGD